MFLYLKNIKSKTSPKQIIALLLFVVMLMLQASNSGLLAHSILDQSISIEKPQDNDEDLEKVSTYKYCHVLEINSSHDSFFYIPTFTTPLFISATQKPFPINKEVSLHHLSYYISLFRDYIATNAP